jgi:hypothetical protein
MYPSQPWSCNLFVTQYMAILYVPKPSLIGMDISHFKLKANPACKGLFRPRNYNLKFAGVRGSPLNFTRKF